jgi:hypothetical protein
MVKIDAVVQNLLIASALLTIEKLNDPFWINRVYLIFEVLVNDGYSTLDCLATT